jgi:hypothetical protein
MNLSPIFPIFGEEFSFHEELAALFGHFPRLSLRDQGTPLPGRTDSRHRQIPTRLSGCNFMLFASICDRVIVGKGPLRIECGCVAGVLGVRGPG